MQGTALTIDRPGPVSLGRADRVRAAVAEAAPPLALMVAFGALLVAVPPAGEFPIDDDWVYARAVQTLLETSRLEVPAWTAASLALQTLWGALFASVFGFSHLTLRCATLTLSAVGALGCYALLRPMVGRGWALVGGLLLLANPLYVTLSYSFMTDVPFLAFALWSLVCYTRAIESFRPRPGWIVAGSLLAGCAFLVRQLGAALPLALLLTLGVREGWRAPARRSVLVPTLAPFGLAWLAQALLVGQRGPVVEDPLAWTVQFWAGQGLGLGGLLLARFEAALTTLGLFSALVALPAVGSQRRIWHGRCRWVAGPALLAFAAGYLVNSTTPTWSPLLPRLGTTLSTRGFQVGNYLGRLPESITLPGPLVTAATALALAGAVLLVLAGTHLAATGALRGPAALPLLFGAIALVETIVYHRFFDRYLLPLVPIALLVALQVGRRGRFAAPLAVAAVVLLASWSIWWERDYLARQAAVWEAGQALVAMGVPPAAVDAGFEWAGWYRGKEAVAAVFQPANAGRDGRWLTKRLTDTLQPGNARWVVTFRRPADAREGRILATTRYGAGTPVYAVQRY